MATIQALEDQGFRVRINHDRVIDGQLFAMSTVRRKGWTSRIEPRGGATRVELLKNDVSAAVAIATCSLRDNFNYRRGREIALGRCVKQLEELVV